MIFSNLKFSWNGQQVDFILGIFFSIEFFFHLLTQVKWILYSFERLTLELEQMFLFCNTGYAEVSVSNEQNFQLYMADFTFRPIISVEGLMNVVECLNNVLVLYEELFEKQSVEQYAIKLQDQLDFDFMKYSLNKV